MGLITVDSLKDAALGAPFVIAGTLVGLAVGRRVSAERFRRASWIGLGLLGVWLALGG